MKPLNNAEFSLWNMRLKVSFSTNCSLLPNLPLLNELGKNGHLAKAFKLCSQENLKIFRFLWKFSICKAFTIVISIQ